MYREHVRIVCVGESCIPARRITRAGLRHEAYPFDWTVSNPDSVAFVLENGWKTARIPALRKSIPKGVYLNEGIGWPHHSNLQQKHDREYMKRCYARLDLCMKLSASMENGGNAETVLLLHCQANHRAVHRDGVVRLAKAFREKYPTARFDVASVEPVCLGPLRESPADLSPAKAVSHWDKRGVTMVRYDRLDSECAIMFYQMSIEEAWWSERDGDPLETWSGSKDADQWQMLLESCNAHRTRPLPVLSSCLATTFQDMVRDEEEHQGQPVPDPTPLPSTALAAFTDKENQSATGESNLETLPTVHEQADKKTSTESVAYKVEQDIDVEANEEEYDENDNVGKGNAAIDNDDENLRALLLELDPGLFLPAEMEQYAKEEWRKQQEERHRQDVKDEVRQKQGQYGFETIRPVRLCLRGSSPRLTEAIALVAERLQGDVATVLVVNEQPSPRVSNSNLFADVVLPTTLLHRQEQTTTATETQDRPLSSGNGDDDGNDDAADIPTTEREQDDFATSPTESVEQLVDNTVASQDSIGDSDDKDSVNDDIVFDIETVSSTSTIADMERAHTEKMRALSIGLALLDLQPSDAAAATTASNRWIRWYSEIAAFLNRADPKLLVQCSWDPDGHAEFVLSDASEHCEFMRRLLVEKLRTIAPNAHVRIASTEATTPTTTVTTTADAGATPTSEANTDSSNVSVTKDTDDT